MQIRYEVKFYKRWLGDDITVENSQALFEDTRFDNLQENCASVVDVVGNCYHYAVLWNNGVTSTYNHRG